MRWDAYGVLDLNNLVVGTANDVTSWKNSITAIQVISDPSTPTGFGEIAGRPAVNSDHFNTFYYLAPVAP